jgi:Cu-Zn family superoxide dismutase
MYKFSIYADEKGTFYFKYYDPLISVKNIYGRSVVIHAKKDDLGLGNNAESLITGNAGNRIACAIIGRASTN